MHKQLADCCALIRESQLSRNTPVSCGLWSNPQCFLCLSVSKKKIWVYLKMNCRRNVICFGFFFLFVFWSVGLFVIRFCKTILTVSSIAKWQVDKKIIRKIKRVTNAIDNAAHCNSKNYSTSNHSTVKSADFFFKFFYMSTEYYFNEPNKGLHST